MQFQESMSAADDREPKPLVSRVASDDNEGRASVGKPLVSVGMGTYRVSSPEKWEWFCKALGSLLAQTYENIEITISDNNSDAATFSKIRERVEGLPNVTMIQHCRTLHPAMHGQYLLQLARGKYFMLVADHDMHDPRFVEKLVDFMEREPGVALAYPRTRLIGPDDTEIKVFDDPLDTRGLSACQRYSKTMWTLLTCNQMYGLFRSEDLLKTDCTRLFVRGCDHVLLAELALQGAITQLDEILFFRRQNRTESAAEWEERNRDGLLRKEDGFLKSISICHMVWSHMVSVEMADLSPEEKKTLLPDIVKCFASKFGGQMCREINEFTETSKRLQDGNTRLSPTQRVKFAEANAIVDLFRGVFQ